MQFKDANPFKSLAILFLAITLSSSCTDDPGSVENQQLQLQASATEVDPGDEVTFEVTAGGSTVDADIYIDSTPITGSRHTFRASGTHTATAKKEGYSDSEEIVIEVAPAKGFTFRSMYVSDGTVYVAGYGSTPTPPHRPTPVYWKDGKLHHLGGNGVEATSVFVSGGDVYIAGYASYPVNTMGTGYWKNGEFHEVALSGAAHAVRIHDNDVYVTGYADYQIKAAYWKNGTLHALTDGTETSNVRGDAIYLSQGDVYVSGAAVYAGPNSVDLYWKNGTRHELPIAGEAHAMDVSDGDVYLAGHMMVDSSAVATYWKNGTLHPLSDGRANFIRMKGNSIHMAGWDCDDTQCTVKYWKNGELVSKYQINGSPALALSFVSEGDVYVVGKKGGNPCYWKNGTRHTLETS